MLARLRGARDAFVWHPAFFRWALESEMALVGSVRPLLRATGHFVRRPASSRSLDEAEQATLYAAGSLEGGDWDAATVDLDRAIKILMQVETDLGARPARARRIRPSALGRAAVALTFCVAPRPILDPWRRLDVALWCLAWSRRAPVGSGRLLRTIQVYVSIEELRPRLDRALSRATRKTRKEIARLLDEATDAAEYALTSFEERAWDMARIDAERLDACLRALREIVRRESSIYLPEPWPFRPLIRQATMRALDRESGARMNVLVEIAHETLTDTRIEM